MDTTAVDAACMTYSATQAARVLGVSHQVVTRMVREGRLPSIDTGARRVVIPRWAVDRLVQPPTTVTVDIPPSLEVEAAAAEASS